jgi:hypothetical protein
MPPPLPLRQLAATFPLAPLPLLLLQVMVLFVIPCLFFG